MSHDHTISSQRIEAFSDAVFAIIVTLLVLDLKVPEIPSHASVQLTLQKLAPVFPQFLSFAMSFLIVCIFWANHHQFFSAVKTADRKMMWLNNFILFWLCFVPFPTAFIGRNPSNIVAVMLFGSVLFLAAATFLLMTHYVLFHSKLVDDHISLSERKAARRRGLLGVICYALAVLFAPFSLIISLTIFIIVPVYYFIPRKYTFN